MANGDRTRLAILARRRAAAAALSPQGCYRSGAQDMERRAPRRRHGRACRRRAAIAAHARARRDDCRTRLARDRSERAAHCGVDSRRIEAAHCGADAVRRVTDQSASLLRPTTDILAAADAITP